MKTYDINGIEVREGIAVTLKPYPHVVLGEGGHKRATWIALGKQDAAKIVKLRPVSCPQRSFASNRFFIAADPAGAPPAPHICEMCGQQYGNWMPQKYPDGFVCEHPDAGESNGSPYVGSVGVIALKDAKEKPNGKYLIVAPRNSDDNRILVLWRVESGYRGGASITAREDVTVIASDSSWHSGRGSLGETAETLAILKPGQELRASRSGRRVQDSRVKLVYDGKTVNVTFGGEEMEAALANEVHGEYL